MILEKKKLFVVILSSLFLIAKAQQSFTKPEAPKTFEYTKYDQIPVGEYTGVPNISIPLYTIAVDEVSIPLNLQYHAGGIRVSDEASYVGLGWNLNFGIISQTINGKDDLKPRNKQKLLYQSTGMGGPAQVWPITCDAYRNMGGGCSADGVVEDYFGSNINLKPLENDFNSMFVATGPVLPHTGLGYPITRSPYGAIDNSVSDPQSDFEPDIFRVSFFGYSLKFMLDFDTTGVENFIVLDNKGYKITKTLNANGFYDWSITTPQGDVYVFSNYKEENNSSSGSKIAPDWSYENPGSGSSTKNNKWYLSKIINLKNKIITFNYTDFGTSTARSFDQKYRKIKQTSKYSSQGLSGTYASIGDYSTSALSEMTETSYNSVTENLIYLSSIESDDVKAYFTYSGRSDRSNDVKLDNIKVKNGNNTLVKEYSFLYDYFISANTGNIINYSSDASYETLKRLKLVSLQETGMPAYSFLYDPIVLPQKNSTAVDFWGFYNGQTTNISTAPNPFQLGYTDMGNNGNNNASNATYSKACSLKEINYPTGGKSSYEYELHEFNKGTADTALPNSDGTIGTIIKGYGNRIKSISLWDNGVIQKQTNYSYSGGISVVPIELHYSYYRDVGSLAVATDIVNPYIMQTLLINDFKSSSYFQPSLFSGINSVGYDTVSMEEVSNGVTNGKTVVSFYNNKALAPSPSTDYKNFMTLPARENINVVENGKVFSTKYFDKNDYINPIKTTVNNYTINKSNIYYSTKICGFRTYCGADGLGGVQAVISPQYLVGYYLIYDKQSLLSREVTIDVFPTGSIISTLDYGYDSNNQITSVTKSDSVDGTIYYESTNYATSPSSLVTKNILNLPSSKSIFNNGKLKETSKYSYDDTSGIVVLKEMDILPLGNPDPTKTKSVFYDAYDVKGNIAEFHIDKGIHTCVIWGYNETVPIAKIDNITYSNIPFSTITNLQNLSDADNDNCITNTCKEQLLRNELNLLRSSFPYALVTTYTYNPLIGVTSITDPKGLTSYYEYDAFNRLKFIKDQDLNILQRNCYNYKGQSINCSDLSSSTVITYKNIAKSGSFARNNCATGGTPSTVTYSVGAGAYSSTLSQADADAKAQNDVNNNGQAYANANGICTFKNVVKSGSFTRNNCSAGGTTTPVIYTVAAGLYSSTSSQLAADGIAQMDLDANGQAYANTNGICTYPVPSATSLLLLNSATLNSLSFYWNSVEGATGYKIYQNGVYVSSTTGPSGSISGLSSATTYNIQVSAYNDGGVEGPLCASVPMTTLSTYVNKGTIYNSTGHTISAGTMQVIANGSQKCSIEMPSLAAGATFSFNTTYSSAIYSNGTFELNLYSATVGIASTNYFYMQNGSSSTNGYFSNKGWGWKATVISAGPQYSLSIIIK